MPRKKSPSSKKSSPKIRLQTKGELTNYGYHGDESITARRNAIKLSILNTGIRQISGLFLIIRNRSKEDEKKLLSDIDYAHTFIPQKKPLDESKVNKAILKKFNAMKILTNTTYKDSSTVHISKNLYAPPFLRNSLKTTKDRTEFEDLLVTGYDLRDSQAMRRRCIMRSVVLEGTFSLGKRLNVLYVFNKKRNTKLAAIFKADADYVYSQRRHILEKQLSDREDEVYERSPDSSDDEEEYTPKRSKKKSPTKKRKSPKKKSR